MDSVNTIERRNVGAHRFYSSFLKGRERVSNRSYIIQRLIDRLFHRYLLLDKLAGYEIVFVVGTSVSPEFLVFRANELEGREKAATSGDKGFQTFRGKGWKENRARRLCLAVYRRLPPSRDGIRR